ncbi:O-methylsterigmatocystin oxidoreductase [Mycena sanguinolenta]|uniref:O-methylsterigmatocystin oxidoreductase n=1 Tax=Mycena sanguinolenta TaxID=230812 RepID=A0A8H7CQG5_9AGAR|nr:O-methylsterigmatocystin oxidoreductase [Mycena sanguinolenta]
MFGNHVVILNSVKAATELLEKRAIIYSDRLKIPMISLMGWDFTFAVMPYTDKWREHIRRLFHQCFRKNAIAAYNHLQIRKIEDLLHGLLSTPQQFGAHIEILATAITMEMVYGYDKPLPDRLVYLPQEAVRRFSESVLPGAFAVNTFPFLRHVPAWFPGAGFHTFARDTRRLLNEMKDEPFQYVKQNMQSASDRQSVLRDLLERNDRHRGSKEQEQIEQIIKDIAAVAYSAAVETTTTTLIVFIMAMALNPEVVQKAQNELDTVVGQGGLPGFEHRIVLPYCEAVFREVFRWRPIAPLAMAHATSEDDVYEGYYIPKGWSQSTLSSFRILILAQEPWFSQISGAHKCILRRRGTETLRAMVHDETKYPNPDEFNPERFLNVDGQLNVDDQVLGFGFGRRACAGRHIADEIVWATIVCVLSTFNIAKAKDEGGNEIEIEPIFTDGLVSHPKPFKCTITPRNDATRQLIASTTDM